MSFNRAGQSKSQSQKAPRQGLGVTSKLGLLAASSLLPILAAPVANAQCAAVDSANQTVPLNALTSNSTTTCSGTVTNQVLVDAPGAENVTVNFAGGSNISGLITTFDSINSQINTIGSTTINNSFLGGSGDGAFVGLFVASGSNNTVSVSGDNSTVLHLTGALNVNGIALDGNNNRFESGLGSSITGFGAATGNGVLSGGGGANTYAIGGSLTARNDGLLITDTGGDDTYFINPGATLATTGGATGRIVDQDGVSDVMLISGDHNLFLDIVGVEALTYVGLPGEQLSLRGTGDFTDVRVSSGIVGQFDVGGMMEANGVITIDDDAYLRYAVPVFAPVMSQTLIGSGEFHLDGATAQITGDNSLFSGTFRVSGTAMVGSNSNAFGSASIINENGDIFLAAASIANDISGTGRITMQGTGGPSRAHLLGANSYTGGTLITNTGSTLVLGNANAAGPGTVTVNGGAALELEIGAAGGNFTNLVTGAGSLAKSGAGTITLANAGNDYAGGTTINAGVVRVTDFAALGSGAVVANSGGALMYDYSGSANQLLAAPLMTGAGQFIKSGTGTIVMGSANAWTGGTQIQQGRIGLNTGDGLGTGAIDVAQGAILGIGGITLANNVSGAGQIVKTASNIATLTGTNTLTGGIVIQGGSIEVASGSSLGAGPVDIQLGTSLLLTTAADTSVAAQLGGDGALTKSGGGRAELTGANTLAGTVSVQSGALAVSGSGNIGTAGVTVGTGATLELASASGVNTLSNTVSGDGRVVKTGAGTVVVTGANTYTGGTQIQAGALRINDVAQLGTGGIVVDSGAALDFNVSASATFNHALSGTGALRKSGAGSLTLQSNSLTGGLDIADGNVTVNTVAAAGSGPISTSQGASLTIANSATEVSSTSISGAGQLVKNGSGDLIIQNASTFTGGTTINAGRIGLNNGQGLGTGGVQVNSAAVLSLGGVTVANNIAGAGSVLKTSQNVGVLSGANTYSGGTTIQDGTLRVAGAQSLGTGAVSVGAGASLDITGNTSSTMANVIQGAGALQKGGTGALTIASANTFSGGTTIAGGALIANHAQALGTGAVTVNANAALALGDIAFANQVSGAGSVIKTGTGLTVLTGGNTYTGGTSISAGTLRVAGASAIGAGAVNVSSGATFEMANTAGVTFANALSGAGTFRKTGAGDLTFSSPFSIGTLALDAGRTRLNAAVTGAAVVGSSATLNGTGTVIGALTNNGVVAPGNSIGTLNVQGNYIHNSSSVLEIEFDAAGGIDLLNVTGTAQLNGGTLRFVSLGGAEGSGGTFLTAAGGVTGTFATVETVGAQLPLSVIYQPTSATMAPSVLTARPSTFNSQALAGSDTAIAFASSIARNMPHASRGRTAWAEGFGAAGARSAAGQTLAYDHDSSGFALGVQTPLGERLEAGVSLGWSQSDITLGQNGGGGQQDAMFLSANGVYRFDGVSVGAGVLYGLLDQSASRNVSFSGFSETVSGETDGQVIGGFLSADTVFGKSGGWTFGGSAQASYVSHTQDGYTESGASPLRLSLQELTFETLGLDVGITASTEFELGGRRATFGLAAGLSHTTAIDDRVLPVAFAVSNAGIDLQGDTRDHTSPYAGADFAMSLSDNATFKAGYTGRFGEDERQEGRIGVNIAF